MIHTLGDQIILVTMTDREIVRPVSHGYFYDPSGDDWPKNSILFGPYEKTKRLAKPTRYAKRYYGDDAPLYEMKVDLPPRSLSEWKFGADIKQIFYLRRGKRFPFPYQHRFKKRRLWGFGKKLPAHLYRRSKFDRVELPPDTVINWRGIVFP